MHNDQQMKDEETRGGRNAEGSRSPRKGQDGVKTEREILASVAMTLTREQMERFAGKEKKIRAEL